MCSGADDIIFRVLRELDDGIEIAALAGRGSVRLRAVERPWNDTVLDFWCELTDAGVTAATSVRTLDGDGIVAWLTELAESYEGWSGVRSWVSLERDARVDAVHDGRGHVGLRFILRGPRGYDVDAWEASVSVGLDAGEDMRNLATAITMLIR